MNCYLNRENLAKIDAVGIAGIRDSRRIKDLNLDECLPHVLPSGWRLYAGGRSGDDGACYVHRGLSLSAIVSFALEDDGKRWAHLSIASPHALPSWDRLRECKDLFLGDRKAIMVLPQKADYVNIHEYCLHLFACLDGDGPPDFTSGTASL